MVLFPLALVGLLPTLLIYTSLSPAVLSTLPSGYANDLTSNLVPDVAGLPDVATRLKVTNNANLTLACRLDGDQSTAGYAHFANATGVEDRHMFWWCVPASTWLLLLIPSSSRLTQHFT